MTAVELSNPATNAVLDHVEHVRDAGISETAARTARRLIADCVGTTVAGLDTETAQTVLDYSLQFSGGSGAPIIGDGRCLPLGYAALTNGTAAHALDYDDDEPIAFVGHPSSPILAALLPAGAAAGVDGELFVRAYAAGVEVQSRIGDAVNPAHYNAGWHATSSLGVFGSTVALALLKSLHRDQMVAALGIAASQAGGLKRNFGTKIKPLHVGLAGQAAVLAVDLALRGFDADPTVLDGPEGVLELFAWGTKPALGAFDDLGTRAALLEPGINIKRFPACSSSHPAVDAMLEIRESVPDLVQRLDRVDCYVAPGTDSMLQYPDPDTPLQAKFSLQWTLALAACNGNVEIDDFSESGMADTVIREVGRRVRMCFDEGLNRDRVSISTSARVVVHLKDGTTREHTAVVPKGSPQYPLTDDDLHAKFAQCCARGRAADDIETAFGQLLELDTTTDVTATLALLDRPAA